MSRITVVIEDHAEGIHLGQPLAGGRVVAAMQGDHSELLEALERIVDACSSLDFDGAPSDAAMEDARAAITRASA